MLYRTTLIIREGFGLVNGVLVAKELVYTLSILLLLGVMVNRTIGQVGTHALAAEGSWFKAPTLRQRAVTYARQPTFPVVVTHLTGVSD